MAAATSVRRPAARPADHPISRESRPPIPDILGTERARFEAKRPLVVGAGHGAANALLYLAELAKQLPGTRLMWSVRSAALKRSFGGADADASPARG
jgi:hypothetical protein